MRVLTPKERLKKAEYGRRVNERRAALVDRTCAGSGKAKQERVTLGIALLHRRALPGVPLTYEDIAVWAGCTLQNVQQIEQKALRKVRKHLGRETAAHELAELLAALHGR